MTKKLSFISVIIFCFLVVPFLAQNASGQSPTRDNELSQRIAERLQRLKTADLDTGEVRALKAKCKAAQNKIQASKKVAEAYSQSQSQQVNKIIENVTRLSSNLKAKNIDPGQIDTLLGGLNELERQIETRYQDYVVALDDSAKVECEANPEGFKASLVDARERFRELADLRKSLKELIKTDLKKSLTELKGSL